MDILKTGDVVPQDVMDAAEKIVRKHAEPDKLPEILGRLQAFYKSQGVTGIYDASTKKGQAVFFSSGGSTSFRAEYTGPTEYALYLDHSHAGEKTSTSITSSETGGFQLYSQDPTYPSGLKYFLVADGEEREFRRGDPFTPTEALEHLDHLVNTILSGEE